MFHIVAEREGSLSDKLNKSAGSVTTHIATCIGMLGHEIDSSKGVFATLVRIEKS